MQGLIVKDLLNIKKQLMYYLVFIALYLVLAINAGMADFFGTMVSILCAMLPITALAYDERAKWDRYALAMPVSRRDIVWSKYLLGLMFCAGAFVVNVIFQFVAGDGGPFVKPVLYVAAGLFFLAVLLPLMFRFGVERGRILMILVAMLPAAAIGALPQISEDVFENMLSSLSMLSVLLVCALCFFVSIQISMRIYRKKEIS